MDRTYISVPGLLSREVHSFLSSIVVGGEDVFVGEDLRRVFHLQAAFKATRPEKTTTIPTTTTRHEVEKLEEPKTEVSVKEEIYDEEEADENEGFEDLQKSQTERLMLSLKDPDTGRTYWQCAECGYHNKSAKSSKYRVERHVRRHRMDKLKLIRTEPVPNHGVKKEVKKQNKQAEEMVYGIEDQRIIVEKADFPEDAVADPEEDFEMDLKQDDLAAYQPTLFSHVDGAGYSCETCGKSFRSHKERKQHSLRHNNVRHPCDTCGKDFNTPRDLRKHM